MNYLLYTYMPICCITLINKDNNNNKDIGIKLPYIYIALFYHIWIYFNRSLLFINRSLLGTSFSIFVQSMVTMLILWRHGEMPAFFFISVGNLHIVYIIQI